MADGHTYSFEDDALTVVLGAIKAYAYKFEEGFPTCRNWVYTESGGTKFSAQSSLTTRSVCPGAYIQGPNAATRAWGGQVIGPGAKFPGPTSVSPQEGPPEDQTAKFNSFYNSVDSSMRKFYGIPDGVLAESEAEKGWGVVDGIAVDNVSVPLDDGAPSPRPKNTDLVGYFTTMESNMSEMSGTTIDSVQTFVSKLKAVLGNIAKVAAYWNASLLSESSILKKTKASLAETCLGAALACDKLCEGKSSSLFPDKTGKILSLLSSIIGLGKAKTVADALAGAAGAAGAVVDDETVSVDYRNTKCNTADDVLTTFNQVVSDIDSKFRNAEQALADQLQKACDIAQGDDYVLTLDPAETATRNTEVNYAKIRKVAECLDNIKQHIDAAALGVSQQSMSSAVRRDGPAGNYYYGAAGAFENLREIIHSLLTHLSWQVGEASINVRAAADLFEGTDGDAQARLDQSAREVNEKNTQGGKPDFHMPWENQKDESAKREEQRKKKNS